MLSFVNVAFSIFFILNALGQIPLFLAILSPYDLKRQRKIIFRELSIALAILLLFIFFGNWILGVLGIDNSAIGISGGILLFIISLTMIFPKDPDTSGLPKHEPLVVPIAIPVMAGPGSIAMVMVYAEKVGNPFTVAAATFLAWTLSLLILLISSYLKKFVGEKGLKAVERLGGMIVSLIGVQMFAKGVIDLVKKYFF